MKSIKIIATMGLLSLFPLQLKASAPVIEDSYAKYFNINPITTQPLNSTACWAHSMRAMLAAHGLVKSVDAICEDVYGKNEAALTDADLSPQFFDYADLPNDNTFSKLIKKYSTNKFGFLPMYLNTSIMIP